MSCVRVNVIPVIAKSDTLTVSELKLFKQRIQDDLKYHKISYFNFPYDPEVDDDEGIADNRELQSMIPFSMVGAEDTFVVAGREVRGRKYHWGVVEVDNAQHCDFSRLRYALFTSHLQDFKDVTHDILYENYRTLKLQQEEKKIAHSREGSNEGTELQQVFDSFFISQGLLLIINCDLRALRNMQ